MSELRVSHMGTLCYKHHEETRLGTSHLGTRFRDTDTQADERKKEHRQTSCPSFSLKRFLLPEGLNQKPRTKHLQAQQDEFVELFFQRAI